MAFTIFLPQRPGAIVRGIATAHSAPPLDTIIQSEESYVWAQPKAISKDKASSQYIPQYQSLQLRTKHSMNY